MAWVNNKTPQDKRTGYTFQGKEIALTKAIGRPIDQGIRKQPGFYPEEKRIEVATIFAVTGNKTTVETLTGVPKETVARWVREDWFQALLEAIRAENDHIIDAKQTEIINDALDQIGDRVKNGDFKVTRDGDLVRVPMTGKDLSLVEAINLDKRQLLRGKPTSRTETVNNQTVEAKLQTLAENFRQIVSKQPQKELVIEDAVVIEEGTHTDVHAERNSGGSQ